jgi:hypothetical protein
MGFPVQFDDDFYTKSQTKLRIFLAKTTALSLFQAAYIFQEYILF